MLAHLRRIIGVTAAAALVAGCSIDAFTYTVGSYGTVNAVHVHLGCRDTYEVFDRKGSDTLLVVTTALNEALVTSCSEGAGLLSQAERMRRIATIFLPETTDRPDCRIARETEISPYHTEFAYRCPPAAKPPAEPRRARRG